MTVHKSITVTVNGEQREIRSELTVAAMLRELGIEPAKVAVERNRDIVPRSTLEEVKVGDRDEFEIVHFVGGG